MSKTNRIPKAFQLSDKARIVPRDQRHEVSPQAFEPRNIKVRVTMYLDSDIVNFFKELSEKGARYQTQINAALREVMERSTRAASDDVAANLRQAQGLIRAALRKIS